MATQSYNVISLSFWKSLQSLKVEISRRSVGSIEFDADPIGILEREGLDAEIALDGGSMSISLVGMLRDCSTAQRETIVQYLRPVNRPLVPNADQGDQAAASGASSVSTAANAVSIANAGVVSNTIAFANVITNANVVSNVNLVAAVAL